MNKKILQLFGETAPGSKRPQSTISRVFDCSPRAVNNGGFPGKKFSEVNRRAQGHTRKASRNMNLKRDESSRHSLSINISAIGEVKQKAVSRQVLGE